MQSLPLGLYQDSTFHPPLKVSLFEKLYQLEGVVNQLRQVVALPHADREAWTTEHRVYTLQMLREFQEYVRLDLNHHDVDKEMVALLTDYSRALQEFTVILHTLFPDVRLKG